MPIHYDTFESGQNKKIHLFSNAISCIAAFMVIFVKLHKHHLLQREDQAVSLKQPVAVMLQSGEQKTGLKPA